MLQSCNYSKKVSLGPGFKFRKVARAPSIKQGGRKLWLARADRSNTLVTLEWRNWIGGIIISPADKHTAIEVLGFFLPKVCIKIMSGHFYHKVIFDRRRSAILYNPTIQCSVRMFPHLVSLKISRVFIVNTIDIIQAYQRSTLRVELSYR